MGRGKTLRDLVIESGLTQQQIADRLEVERPRVTAMMNANDMKISTAIRLAKVLGVSLKTLAESIGQNTEGLPDDCNGGEEN